ncbi:MAG: hypothetical protein NT128_06885, partial [Proteobacteria bacterium]|nr:hypothetical protein [Pseudomonadota bacterium]
MKKKLLFSLLLGSAFSWMNGVYAEETAKVDAVKEKSAEAGKDSAPKAAAKKYKATDLDGSVKDVTFFEDEGYTGETRLLNLQDGLVYSGNPANNFPYMAGEDMPKGHAVVYVGRKKGSTDELKFFPANANLGPFKDNYDFADKELWMYFDGKSLYPYKEIPDTNAKKYLGKDGSIYQYKLPDEATTALKAEVEAAKKAGGGGTTSPAANSAGNPKFAELAAIIDSAQKQSAKAAEELKVLLAGTHTNNGSVLSQVLTIKGVELTIVSTDPAALKNPSLFAQYADGVVAMLSKYPQVAAALIAQMAPDSVPGKVDTLSESRLADTLKENGTDVTISGSLSFASSVTPEQARKLRNELMETYGSNKQAVPTAPMAPALVAPVAISSASAVPDVIPAGLSPLAEQLLKRKSQLKKVETGTAATEINAEIAKSAIKDAELAAAEAEKAKLEAELAATRAVAASALEAAQKNQAQEDANAAKLKETLIQANAIITAKDAETAQVVATANAELAKKDDEKAQVVASANAIIQQTGAEKAQLEKQATELAGKHEEVTKKLDEAQSTISDIAKANANPATIAPVVVQENVHEAPASSTTVAP